MSDWINRFHVHIWKTREMGVLFNFKTYMSFIVRDTVYVTNKWSGFLLPDSYPETRELQGEVHCFCIKGPVIVRDSEVVY